MDDIAFIVKDLEKRDKIQKARITKDGGITDIKESNLEELEKHIIKVHMPRRVFIKEKIFEDLKHMFGEKVEILINY